jgi:phospholipase/carboxylesterase
MLKMELKTELITSGDWVFRAQAPEGDGPHPVLLLLHGWTGDEDVMWVFASRLPKHYLMIAPRGRNTSRMGGYGWYPDERRDWPEAKDFYRSVDELMEFIDRLPDAAREKLSSGGDQEHAWRAISKGDYSKLSLVGFSQGAALSYIFSLKNSDRVAAIAGLAGFLPENTESLAENRPLAGKEIFVTHGSQDDIVPVQRARNAVELLERAGARVTYCEEDVGHKLSAPCFNALQKFFKAR